MGEAAQSIDFADVGDDAAIREAVRFPKAVPSSAAPLPLRRAMQDGDAYPVEALGKVLGEGVKAASEVIQAPLELCANAALANVALAVQGHANVVMPYGTGKRSPLSLFLLSIAESGDRKTHVDKALGGEAIARFEEMREDEVRGERLSFSNAKEAYEAERSAAKARAVKDGSDVAKALDKVGAAPVEPMSATLTFSDPTIEGLHKQFSKGQPSAGLFSTEGGAFVGGVGMNAENALKTGALLSELWDGAPIKRLRAIDGESTMRNRRLSFHLMMQPGAAHAWLSNPVLQDQGLFSRMLIAAPKSLAGTRFYSEPSPDDLRKLQLVAAHIGDLLDHRLPVSSDKPGELHPRDLPLTDEARADYRKFSDHIEGLIGEGGALVPVKGMASKTPEHAARIAAVLALADDFEAQDVGRDLMRRGIQLAQWYLNEALRLTEAEAFPAELLNAERTLDWLKSEYRGGKLFSLPCLYMNGPRPVRSKESANKVVAVLLDHNWLEKVDGSHRINGVVRRECYRLREG